MDKTLTSSWKKTTFPDREFNKKIILLVLTAIALTFTGAFSSNFFIMLAGALTILLTTLLLSSYYEKKTKTTNGVSR